MNLGTVLRRFVVLAALAALAACATPPPPPTPVPSNNGGFSRQTAVATAVKEWRLFGSPVRDDPPGSHPPLTEDEMPDRQEGLWERVGDYWSIGQNAGTRASHWTGRTNERGEVFPAERADDFAWSAAFISYVMRAAGAGDRFPYAAAHVTYINAAWREANGQSSRWIVVAQRPEAYAPQLGDLICTGRDESAGIGFDDLPARRFPAHCDMVVGINPKELSVIGGNVGAAVSMKHVPIAPDGKLAGPDGRIVDDRYPWFVVLQVQYNP